VAKEEKKLGVAVAAGYSAQSEPHLGEEVEVRGIMRGRRGWGLWLLMLDTRTERAAHDEERGEGLVRRRRYQGGGRGQEGVRGGILEEVGR
jgi:hypothetical protein